MILGKSMNVVAKRYLHPQHLGLLKFTSKLVVTIFITNILNAM